MLTHHPVLCVELALGKIFPVFRLISTDMGVALYCLELLCKLFKLRQLLELLLVLTDLVLVFRLLLCLEPLPLQNILIRLFLFRSQTVLDILRIWPDSMLVLLALLVKENAWTLAHRAFDLVLRVGGGTS